MSTRDERRDSFDEGEGPRVFRKAGHEIIQVPTEQYEVLTAILAAVARPEGAAPSDLERVKSHTWWAAHHIREALRLSKEGA